MLPRSFSTELLQLLLKYKLYENYRLSEVDLVKAIVSDINEKRKAALWQK